METAQLDALTQFISRLPPEDFDNMGEIGQARVFIWFGQEASKTPLTGGEIEDCYIQVGLNIPKNSIESRMRKDRCILKLPGNKYAIEKGSKTEFDIRYGKFIGLPKIDGLRVKPPLLSHDEIAGAYKMAKSYVFLYLIENSARKWIMNQMSKELGPNWWQIIKDGPKNAKSPIETIKNNAQKLEDKEKRDKVINPLVHDLYFCKLGELIDLLFYIKQSRKNSIPQTVQAKMIDCLRGINEIRDLVAHNRALTVYNETRLEQLYVNWCQLLSD